MAFKLNNDPLLWKTGGWFVTPIQYEVRVPDGNWKPYFGIYESQKYGSYDTESCWAMSGINCVEIQLEWLYKNNQFYADAVTFFKINGYMGEDGSFSLSERYIEILGGQKDNGGSAPLFWQTVQKYGLIPRSTLSYTDQKAFSFSNTQAFVDDYFNTDAITIEMRLKAKQFMQYVNVAYQQIGTLWETPEPQILLAALRQAPLQIGIPVPSNPAVNWNKPVVTYDGGKTPQHEITLYTVTLTGLDIQNGYPVLDQYNPFLKNLSSDYYIPFVHQGIVSAIKPNSPNPIPQNNLWNAIWTSVMNFFNTVKGIFGV